MRFLTDRKRATGNGSGRAGTHHHWQMMVNSALLLVCVPLFVLFFGLALGGDQEQVQAFLSRPVVAIVMGLSLFVIVNHLKNEAHEAIEDYMHGAVEKLALIVASAFAYTVIAAGLFALARIAL